MKLTADILGYVATFFFVIATQFPKKSQIMICYAVANLSTAASVVFLLGGLSSAVTMSLTGFVHICVNLYHHYRNEEPSKKEKIFFACLYLVAGLLGVRRWLDILPIVASLFFMWSVFQTDEQKIRLTLLGNAFFYLIYYFIIRSTVVYAEIFSDISIITSLIRYRKAKQIPKSEVTQDV